MLVLTLWAFVHLPQHIGASVRLPRATLNLMRARWSCVMNLSEDYSISTHFVHGLVFSGVHMFICHVAGLISWAKLPLPQLTIIQNMSFKSEIILR